MNFETARKHRAQEQAALKAEHERLKAELEHGQVRPVHALKPAPENDAVYSAIAWDDPQIRELARSIKEIGIQVPILVSGDDYIVSGHRRWIAAQIAGLTEVPVKIDPIMRWRQPQEFIKRLVVMNEQRMKTTSDLLHEAIIKTDPKEAHQQIKKARLLKQNASGQNLTAIDPAVIGIRDKISAAKQPLLDAIKQVLEEQRAYWPLSVRQVHYRLLNIKPLLHASKPDSEYRNDKNSYRAATDICARGRLEGLIEWQAIDDVTRPVELNAAFQNPAEFFKQELRNFLSGYWRNLLQSQPHHIEIVAEILTVQTILQEVAKEFTMPLTISRGMNTLSPKKGIRDRYLTSRKEGLKLLVVTDLDPAGDTIAEDLVKSFKRDFHIHNIEAYKVALTIGQVRQFGLLPSMEAKESSPTYQAYIDKYGMTDAYELEAMDPGDLATVLHDAIEDVIDIDAYNQELRTEEDDSTEIFAVRQQTEKFLQSLKVVPPEPA